MNLPPEKNTLLLKWLIILVFTILFKYKKKFEDSKGVIRNRKSEKSGKYNDNNKNN